MSGEAAVAPFVRRRAISLECPCNSDPGGYSIKLLTKRCSYLVKILQLGTNLCLLLIVVVRVVKAAARK